LGMPRLVVELDADRPSPRLSVTSRMVGEWLEKTLIQRGLRCFRTGQRSPHVYSRRQQSSTTYRSQRTTASSAGGGSLGLIVGAVQAQAWMSDGE
jgi:hypothetical protein